MCGGGGGAGEVLTALFPENNDLLNCFPNIPSLCSLNPQKFMLAKLLSKSLKINGPSPDPQNT